MIKSMFKRSLLLGVLIVGVAQSCVATELHEDMVMSGEVQVDAVGLAVVLSELFSHDPDGAEAYDKAVEYFVAHGCDLNQIFKVKDYANLMYGEGSQRAQAVIDGGWPEEISLLKFSIIHGAETKALLKHGADIKREGIELLCFAAQNYVNYLQSVQQDNVQGCDCCIDLCGQWLGSGIRAIYEASKPQIQQEFLEKHPELSDVAQG